MEAIMHTNLGDIRLELFEDKAPITVTNFVELATGKRAWIDPATGEETQRPLYDGVTFHRVIKDFMIQGGDPLGNGTGGPGYTFDDEIDNSLTFADTYLLAMANAGTRMGHGTNGSQFFITVNADATRHLTNHHTIFGEVTDPESQKVVLEISKTATGPGDVPLDPVVIKSIEVTK